MPFILVFQVDGGCRRNGYYDAIGAATCVPLRRDREPHRVWTRELPHDPTPTNQRAELTGIVMALEIALQRDEELDIQARLKITIESDWKYAIGCMTTWMPKWEANGFVNAAGNEVANRDLLEDAAALEQRIYDQHGSISYEWIPRGENEEADRHCIEILDQM